MVQTYFERNPRKGDQIIGDDPFDITVEEINGVKDEVKSRHDKALDILRLEGSKMKGARYETLVEEIGLFGRWDKALQLSEEEILRSVTTIYDCVKTFEDQGLPKADIFENVFTQFPDAINLVPIFRIPLERGLSWGEDLTQGLLARAARDRL